MNLNRYTREVAVWWAANRSTDSMAVLVEWLQQVVRALETERLLLPTELELGRWVEDDTLAHVTEPSITEVIAVGADLAATCAAILARKPGKHALQIVIRGRTVILQPGDRESELDDLMTVSGAPTALGISVKTVSDAWLPCTLLGQPQSEVYALNAPRMDRALATVAELGFESEPTKLALPAGLRFTNLTFDDGGVLVPDEAFDREDGEACTLGLDEGRIVLGRQVRRGADDEVREGYLLADPGNRVLVTLTRRHDPPLQDLEDQYALDVEGITALRTVCEPPAAGIPYDDALIEALPAGRPASESAPMPEAAVVRLAASLASVLARAHAKQLVIGGVSPELVFVDRDLQLTQIAPRGPRFVASVPDAVAGRSYAADGDVSTSAGDVLALCATLKALAPTTSSAVGALLARGLAADPADRPSAAELADAFAHLAPR